ncbi:MAG: hypothetical protein QM731_01550 [Chitinophagaceae bacterium]
MKQKIISLLPVLLLMQLASFADGYWLELQGNGKKGDTLYIRIRYGGVDEQKNRYINNGAALNKMKDFSLLVIAPDGTGRPVPLKQYADYWQGCYIPTANGIYQVLATDNQLPVVEREDSSQNIKPVQYLCTTYVTGNGKKGQSPASYLYQEISIKNDTALVKPFINGKPVPPGTSLRVFFPDNQDKKIVVTDLGTAMLPLPSKGVYLVRLDQLNSQTGLFEGKKYYAVRHRCDYSLIVK